MIPADGRRVRAAVLGSPVGHSLSPILHMAAYAALGLTWWRYEAIECGEADLPAFLDRCGPDWAGLSLTMPLKRAVLPLLDRVEPLAADIGAANTVLLAAAQRLGYNTDAPGMVKALAAHGVGTSRPAGPALIIGGGATACTALAALGELGERSATALVRDLGRAGDLLSAADRLGLSVTLRSAEQGGFAGHRLIISTIPAGAADFVAEMIPGLAGVLEVVFDVVYHPWPTRLADAAARAEVVVVGGFELLLHQAALQVQLMTGRPAPIDQMREAALAELAGRAAAARSATLVARTAGPHRRIPAIGEMRYPCRKEVKVQAPGAGPSSGGPPRPPPTWSTTSPRIGAALLAGICPGSPGRLPAVTRLAARTSAGRVAVGRWPGYWRAGWPSGRLVKAGRWEWRAPAGQRPGVTWRMRRWLTSALRSSCSGGPACTSCGASCHVRRAG